MTAFETSPQHVAKNDERNGLTPEELAALPAIDVTKLTHECPECGWKLADGGFCIHEKPDGVFDGVPRTTKGTR